MRILILLAFLLAPTWALADVPDYVARSLNKTVVVKHGRAYTVPSPAKGTRYVYVPRKMVRFSRSNLAANKNRHR